MIPRRNQARPSAGEITPHTCAPPFGFTSRSDLPTPTDSRVNLREVPEQVYLVHQFSGNMGTGDGHDAVAEREMSSTVEGVMADGGAFSEYVSADSKYMVARCVCVCVSPACSFVRVVWFVLCVSLVVRDA